MSNQRPREGEMARSAADSRPEGKILLETRDLLLRKARLEDWRDLYQNVWSRPEAARYMLWQVSENEEDARRRMERTVDFHRDHDVYLIVEKKSGQVAGFTGLERLGPERFQEAGIVLGPDFAGRGYGKQILALLLDWAAALGGREFFYSARRENKASQALARSFGFVFQQAETKTDPRTGEEYLLDHYRKELPWREGEGE